MNFEPQIDEILLTNIPDLKRSAITPEADLIRDLGADSLAMMEMLMDLEATFDIEVPEEEAEKLVTVGNVYAYIRQRKEDEKHE